MDAALALSVYEQLALNTVGIAIDWSHLAFASGPRPVWQQVSGVFRCVPFAAVEPVAVFGQAGQVADAKVAAAARPVLVVWCRLAQIVVAGPYKLADNPVFIVLPTPVIVWQIAPRAVFHIIA